MTQHLTLTSDLASWLTFDLHSDPGRTEAGPDTVVRCTHVVARVTAAYFCHLETNSASFSTPDPPQNCYLNVKKLSKTWHFFQNNCQKLSFFSKKLPFAIFLKKMKIFGNFKKNFKFLAIFWQSNGNFPEGQPWTQRHTSKYCYRDIIDPTTAIQQ